MITHEVTVWCDYESPPGYTCCEWVQFNYDDARGQPSIARRLANKRFHYTRTRDGKDWCYKHSVSRTPSTE